MPPDGNLLHREKSPYLLQHADNPVHWRAWGPGTLEVAAAANKPILLSVGYAACHWCHVMAHESFEDAETAALMNSLFVCVKVDREERPDIDHTYMAALHALGEQGGWPLTMFLSPQGEPFWGGTYFPPEPRWGRPSFRQVLSAVARAWHGADPAVHTNSRSLLAALTAGSATRPGEGLRPDMLERVGHAYLGLVDTLHGGLRGAPKFPNAPIFRFLWQLGQRTGTTAYADAVHLMLRRMCQGGIYDHLGGGFARYSTDAEWLAPHFEKMLYDNAQLLELLALAHAANPDQLYIDRAAETVGWLSRDMYADGAFAASEDADSEGDEGRFYVWTATDIEAVIGPDFPPFAAAYDVTEAGNWEGRTILRRVSAPGTASDESSLAAARKRLFAARAHRVRPGRDDKILADWNGLMLAALCRAAAVFDRPDWLELAEAGFARLLSLLSTPDGRIRHAWRDGAVTAAGLLDDQACMARAALSLHELTGRADYLVHATAICEAAIVWFADTDGSFFITAADATDLPGIRPRTASDNATPNGNGMMVEAFARLHHLTGGPIWRRRAEAVIKAFSGAGEQLAGMPTLLAAADLLENSTTAVIIADPRSSAAADLRRRYAGAADPASCVVSASEAATDDLHPSFGKSRPADAQAAVFLCRAGTCQMTEAA